MVNKTICEGCLEDGHTEIDYPECIESYDPNSKCDCPVNCMDNYEPTDEQLWALAKHAGLNKKREFRPW